MNVSISYFAQRLSASLMVCVLFLSLITSCAQTAKDEKTSENIISEDIVDIQLSPEIQARLESMDTKLELPEGLSQEEQVTYIENHVLKTPVSVIELLALQPVHTLDPDERNWDYITEAGWAKFRLMNRFMRMQYVALGVISICRPRSARRSSPPRRQTCTRLSRSRADDRVGVPE